MTRFDGTAARQLDLIPVAEPTTPVSPRPVRPTLRLLKQDVYNELLRRRRRAQIAARHALDRVEAD
jgi:hypothetical protein